MSDIKDYYKSYYNKIDAYRLDDFKEFSRALLIKEWLCQKLKTGDSILDIGCGDGTFAKELPQFSWQGMDINPTESKMPTIAWDLDKTPYPLLDSSQDGVVCSEVLEHLWDPEKVHREAYRLLKPKGIYIISTPNFDWIEHHLGCYRQVLYAPGMNHTKEHIRFYTIETHSQMLDRAGFKVIDFCGADTQFSKFFEPARLFLLEAMPHKTLGEIDLLIGRCFPAFSHTIGVLAVKR